MLLTFYIEQLFAVDMKFLFILINKIFKIKIKNNNNYIYIILSSVPGLLIIVILFFLINIYYFFKQ